MRLHFMARWKPSSVEVYSDITAIDLYRGMKTDAVGAEGLT